MKILLFNNAGLTAQGDDFGVAKKTGEFAKELKELENDVIFFGQKLLETKNTVHVFKIKQNDLKIKGLWQNKNKTINYILLYLRVIPEVWKSDFIYIFYHNAFKYVAFIAKLFGKKFGLYIRGSHHLNDKASHWIYKNAFTVLTVSDHFTNFVNNIAAREVAHTIRPMLDFSEKDIVSNRQYIKKSKYQILFLGRTTDDKGIIELLHAVSELKKSEYDFFLKVVGNGEYFEELQQLAQKLQVLSHVSFEGGVYDPERVRQYYLEADLYILPTYHEGFPRTLYEAMIFGTPVITTFVGGIPSVMKDGVNCKRIDSKSIESIYNILIYAMENYPEMGVLANKATNTIHKIFDERRLTHAQQLNEILKKL